MTSNRKHRLKITSQTLTKHEKRMTDAIQRKLTLLAREINARWEPYQYLWLQESMTQFERQLSSILFRYGFHVAGESGVTALHHFSTKASMDILMEAIRVWLRGYSTQRARIITRYLRGQVQEQLSLGLPDDEVRANVLRIINTKGSAKRIARTETHIALERGAWEAARSLGVRLVKEWATMDDIKTRPSHAAADGQMREIEEPFSVGGESMQYPGDPTASAKQVVNCRCTALYHLVVNGEIKE